jgi:hypothetical protein
VFNQLCGWLGTGDLWVGAVSDTHYNEGEGYLERQEEFADKDLVILENENTPINIDKRFGRKETLLTACVATDRAGNERAVKVCKRAWYVSRGFYPNMSPRRMNDAWTTWSFQANFMFDPVL